MDGSYHAMIMMSVGERGMTLVAVRLGERATSIAGRDRGAFQMDRVLTNVICVGWGRIDELHSNARIRDGVSYPHSGHDSCSARLGSEG